MAQTFWARKIKFKVLSKILLLLRKNLILRKRHYVITICEIFLPILFSVLMSYGRTQLVNQETTFYLRNEQALVDEFCQQCTETEICSIVYNPYAAEVIKELQDYLNKTNQGNYCWTNFSTESEVKDYYTNLETNPSANGERLLVVIWFHQDVSHSAITMLPKISYELRFPNYFNETEQLIPPFPIPGPNLKMKENEELYFKGGFTGLQILIDKILIKILTQNASVPLIIDTLAFPYPPYASSKLDPFFSVLLPQFVAQSFIFVVPAIIGTILSEKETGVKELMKIMGLPSWMHWIGWTLNSLIVPALSATIIVILYVVSFHANQTHVLGYIEPTVWWLVLVLYITSGASFCFLISSLFERPMVGIVAGIVVWLVSYYGFIIPLEEKYRQITLAQKLLLAAFPNLGLHFALKVRLVYEATENGASWAEFMTPMSSLDPLTFGHICLVFAASIFVYLGLTIYLENVIPSTYGVRKPWYYIFQWQILQKLCTRKQLALVDATCALSNRRKRRCKGFEKDPPPCIKVGIELKNLCKVFGARIAVDNVSLKMYEGQITVLIGENGAGKTSVVSLLTGFFAPTGGLVFVNGFCAKNAEQIRENLGFCSQKNMLFGRLTVLEHLMFFAKLKGLTHANAKLEVQRLMGKLHLLDKSNTLSRSLSGGQKRKLSLGCAVVGGSKILILDEPTTGMDAKGRRAVWDLLLEMRPGRTIVLTTQIMEEADVLGDRIGILCNGKLQCYGSSMFLKKCYGIGYKLKIILRDKSVNLNRIIRTIQMHISDADLIENFIPSQTSAEICVNLPYSSRSNVAIAFPTLFTQLMKRKKFLGIKGIEMSSTTMDDVFLKVVQEFRGVSIEDEITNLKETKTCAGNLRCLGLRRFWSLFLKRLVCLFRRRFVVFCQLVTPSILVATAILIGQRIMSPRNPPKPLSITLESYKNPLTLFYSDNDTIAEHYSGVVGDRSEAIRIPAKNISSELLNRASNDLLQFREQYIVGATFDTSNTNIRATAMYSSLASHASPLSVNLISNAVLRALGCRTELEIINHSIQSALQGAAFKATDQIPIISAVFLSIGMGLLSASFVVFPTEERLSKVKHLQLMTGVSPACYWCSIFCCDFTFSLLAIGLMTACFPILESYGTFTESNGLGAAFLIFALQSMGAIIFSYLVSLIAGSAAAGFAVITTVHILFGVGFNVVISYLTWAEYCQIINGFRWIFRLFPSYGSTSCIMTYVRIALANRRCHLIPEDVLNLICTSDKDVGNYTGDVMNPHTCCENCPEFGIENCFVQKPYLEWEYEPGKPGITQELLYMSLMTGLYIAILILIEYRLIRRIVTKIRFLNKQLPLNSDNSDVDADVKEEEQRVEQILEEEGNTQGLMIHKLKKHFGKVNPVSGVSLGLHFGQCFGLMGLNGVGKTTTFRIITGDCDPSSGNVFGINNFSLTHKRDEFLSTVGYCPQEDSLISVLTGREMLQLFCQLRPVPQQCVRFEVAKWLENIGLSANADIQCRNYSGGMRRRLSTAVAMIGDSPIIILDECTSGVDPIAKRQLWNILKTATRAGQAILLTSHSLDECEIICSRIGIMTAGKFRSIGSVPYLKRKFNQGFSLTVKVKYLLATDESLQRKLDESIKKHFHTCELKYQNQNILQYHLMNKEISWSDLFKALEGIKAQYPNFLDEYTVSETTLEQILTTMSSDSKHQGLQVTNSEAGLPAESVCIHL